MADFQRMMARHSGQSLRTIRRRCEQDKLPGVYRTRSGRYRLIGPCLEQLRQADKAFRNASPALRKIYRTPLKQQIRWLKQLNEVLRVSSALNGGPALYRAPRHVPIKQLLHPRTIEVAEHPRGPLMIHAEKLRSQQIEIRPLTLARSLQISLATLYRRYKSKEIKQACNLGRGDWPYAIPRIAKKKWTKHVDRPTALLRRVA
jgi:hypothetical protein